ncbi:hypothetical protein [Candidatus Accumulibacter sp. ACC003]|uniref:hypothetical protein n=1 Tax=Candidatus Accumulibacter sp. ACC003 TaxID=2823334 RepID=UPI0025BE6C3A|nr:hypothetical protein [Candidatus Accumulibacter sp. ACC003]
MLNIAIEQKTGFFQKTDSSLFVVMPVGRMSGDDSPARVSDRGTYFIDSVLPVAPRPAYEWVVPSSSTSLFSAPLGMMKELLAVSDAELETSRDKADSAVKGVLVSAYNLDKGGFGRLAAQEVMLFVEKNLKRNGLTEANRLLELADASKLSSRSLIGLIRSTARLKDRLPAWGGAYLKSRSEVTKQGKNPDALFVGLPKLQESDAPKATP